MSDSPPRPPQSDDFESVVASLQPRIRRILARHRVPTADAQDLLQDTLLSAFRAWERLRAPDRYILNVLSRRCRFYWGDRRHERLQALGDLAFLEHLAPELAPDQERLEMLLDLEALIPSLSPQHRELLILRYRDGRSTAECAELLGYKASSIRALSARTLQRLLRLLEATRDPRPPKA